MTTRKRGPAPLTPEERAWAVEDMTLVDDEFMKAALKGRLDCLQLIARAALGDGSIVVKEMRD